MWWVHLSTIVGCYATWDKHWQTTTTKNYFNKEQTINKWKVIIKKMNEIFTWKVGNLERRENLGLEGGFSSSSMLLPFFPKFDNGASFGDYKIISLCNCIYNLTSKVIAKRIWRILSSEILFEQIAFLERRKLHNAIGII